MRVTPVGGGTSNPSPFDFDKLKEQITSLQQRKQQQQQQQQQEENNNCYCTSDLICGKHSKAKNKKSSSEEKKAKKKEKKVKSPSSSSTIDDNDDTSVEYSSKKEEKKKRKGDKYDEGGGHGENHHHQRSSKHFEKLLAQKQSEFEKRIKRIEENMKDPKISVPASSKNLASQYRKADEAEKRKWMEILVKKDLKQEAIDEEKMKRSFDILQEKTTIASRQKLLSTTSNCCDDGECDQHTIGPKPKFASPVTKTVDYNDGIPPNDDVFIESDDEDGDTNSRRRRRRSSSSSSSSMNKPNTTPTAVVEKISSPSPPPSSTIVNTKPATTTHHDVEICDQACCVAFSLNSLGFINRSSHPELYEKHKNILPPAYCYPKLENNKEPPACVNCHLAIAKAEGYCHCGCLSECENNQKGVVVVTSVEPKDVVHPSGCIYCLTNTNPSLYHILGYLDKDKALTCPTPCALKPELQDFYIYPELVNEVDLTSSSAAAPVVKIPAEDPNTSTTNDTRDVTAVAAAGAQSLGSSQMVKQQQGVPEEEEEEEQQQQQQGAPEGGEEEVGDTTTATDGSEDTVTPTSTEFALTRGRARGRIIGGGGGGRLGRSRGQHTQGTTNKPISSGFGMGSKGTGTATSTTTTVTKMNVIPKTLFTRNHNTPITAKRTPLSSSRMVTSPRQDVWLVRPANIVSKNPRKNTLNIHNRHLGTYIPNGKTKVWANPALWWLVGANLREYAPYSRDFLWRVKRLKMPHIVHGFALNIYQPGSIQFRCMCFDEYTGIQCPYSAGLICDQCGSFHYCTLEHRIYAAQINGGFYCPNSAEAPMVLKSPHSRWLRQQQRQHVM